MPIHTVGMIFEMKLNGIGFIRGVFKVLSGKYDVAFCVFQNS